MGMAGAVKRLAASFRSHGDTRWDVPFVGLKDVPRLVIVSDQLDATYFATFHYPLKYLQGLGVIDFAVLSRSGIERRLLGQSIQDVMGEIIGSWGPTSVILSRYAVPCAQELIMWLQSQKIPTMYYLDDNLLAVPSSLGQSVVLLHNADEVREARRYCLEHVDTILVSTEQLRAVLASQFPGKPILQLHYPPYLGHVVRGRRVARRHSEGGAVTIGYMGSKGHREDLRRVVPALVSALERFPQARFETFGTITMPHELRQFGTRVLDHPPKRGYEEFLQYLHDLRWDIGLAPIEDHEFNRCRSPIKFMEYTACGIVTVASDMDVYRGVIGSAGGVLVSGTDWQTALEFVLANPMRRPGWLACAEEVCTGRYALQTVAEQFARSLNIPLHQ